jgi:hypothetical protein
VKDASNRHASPANLRRAGQKASISFTGAIPTSSSWLSETGIRPAGIGEGAARASGEFRAVLVDELGYRARGRPVIWAKVDGMAEGHTAAPRLAALFAGHARRLEQELAALRVRHAYTTAKAALWQARADGDRAAEQEAAAGVLRIMGQLRGHDTGTRR